MTDRFRIVGVGVAVALAASTGALVWQRATARAKPAEAVTPEQCGPVGVRGERRTWTLHLELGLQRSRNDAPMTTVIDGTLDAVSSGAADKGECAVAWTLSNARVSGSGATTAPSEEQVHALERTLSSRLFVTYDQTGAATRAYFAEALEPGQRNLLQTMVSETQFVASTTPSSHWTTRERDGAGLYLASYTATEPGHVRKTKLRYLTADGAASSDSQAAVDVKVLASERQFMLDDSRRLAAVRGHEILSVGGLGSESEALGVSLQFELGSLRLARDSAMTGGFAEASAGLKSYPIVTHRPGEQEEQARIDRELVGTAVLSDLLAALHAPAASESDAQRLASWLRLHPADVPTIVAEVRTQGGAAKSQLRALASSGVESAQQALCSLASDSRLPSNAFENVMTAMIEVKHPSAELLRCARRWLDANNPAQRRAALLTAGSLAHAARVKRPAEASQLEVALLDRLASTSEVSERIDIVRGLGNSAGPASFAALQAVLREESPALRSAAARSLRLVEGARADSLLAATIERDAHPTVRAAAIFAAGFRPVSPVLTALLNAAEKDKSDFVRSDAVTLLGHNLSAGPEVAPTLQRISEHDAKPGVRRLAREVLERGLALRQ